MRKLSFEKEAWEELHEWIIADKKISLKISELIQDILKNPFEGLGKPEALRHNRRGLWSRRINLEHRLVYQVFDDEVFIVTCKYHYTK